MIVKVVAVVVYRSSGSSGSSKGFSQSRYLANDGYYWSMLVDMGEIILTWLIKIILVNSGSKWSMHVGEQWFRMVKY